MIKEKLGNFIDVSRGMTLPGINYSTTGKYIRLTLGNFNEKGGFKDNTSKKDIYYNGKIKPEFLLKKGDLITPLTEQTYGLLGSTARIPESNKYVQSQDVGLIKCKEGKLAPSFCYYLISSPMVRKQLSAAAQQTKIRHTSPDKIKDVMVIVPEYENQVKIGILLDALTNKIELNNKINAELERMAKTLYDYWFIQFDFPDGNGRAYKSSNGPMVYNEVLKREIPAGWKVETLLENSLTKLIKTGIPTFKGEKIYLPTACISEDKIIDTTTKITYENRESRANMMPIQNSVWFAKMKNTNKHLYFGDYSQDRINKIILSTGMCGLECPDYALEYLWNFIQNKQFEDTKDILASGAIQPAINNNDLNSIYILIPDTSVLKMYSQKVKPLLEMKYNNEEEIFKLEKLRDFLLPLLMNGQVKVEQ